MTKYFGIHLNKTVRRAISFIFTIGLGLAMIAPVAHADEIDHETRLTFNHSIMVPGNKVLPPGTYWFKLVSPTANQNIVQILGANKTDVIATILTIPATRDMQTISETMVNISEGNGPEPDALLAWFYPGETRGAGFVFTAPESSELTHRPIVMVKVQPYKNTSRASGYVG